MSHVLLLLLYNNVARSNKGRRVSGSLSGVRVVCPHAHGGSKTCCFMLFFFSPVRHDQPAQKLLVPGTRSRFFLCVCVWWIHGKYGESEVISTPFIPLKQKMVMPVQASGLESSSRGSTSSTGPNPGAGLRGGGRVDCDAGVDAEGGQECLQAIRS